MLFGIDPRPDLAFLNEPTKILFEKRVGVEFEPVVLPRIAKFDDLMGRRLSNSLGMEDRNDQFFARVHLESEHDGPSIGWEANTLDLQRLGALQGFAYRLSECAAGLVLLVAAGD
jgi:hypothetical protein